MITTQTPADWQDLEEQVAQVLHECGFSVEVEKPIAGARGTANIDVWAEEVVKGRRYTVFVECKQWAARVPQGVVHSFRTVMSDAGAHIGYIVSAAGFQAGAFAAASNTNVRLVTWEEFQTEFEATWVERFLLRHVVDEIDPLFSLIEPLLPRWVNDLDEAATREFFALREKYVDFGWLMMLFTPYSAGFGQPPTLPIRGRVSPDVLEAGVIPDEILDAVGYREFLAHAIPHGVQAIAAFRSLRPPSTP